MNGPRRIVTLQVLRGIAANMVVISHVMGAEHRHLHGILPSELTVGFAGVDIFFVLSGFVMVLVSDRSPFIFLVDRATRIYPAYWAVSLIVLPVWLIAPALVNASVTGEVSVLKSFLLIPQPTLPLLAVGWTLIHELYFYLVFAVLLALRVPLLPGLIAWGMAAITLRQWADSPAALVATSPMTLEFIAGALAALTYRARRTAGWPVLLAGIVSFLAALVIATRLEVFNSPSIEWWRTVLFALPATLLVYALAVLDGRISCPRIFVAAGDWSYSTYLLHVLVVVAFARGLAFLDLPAVLAAGILIGVGIAASNFAGAASFALIERPSLKFLRQRFRSTPEAVQTPAVETNQIV